MATTNTTVTFRFTVEETTVSFTTPAFDDYSTQTTGFDYSFSEDYMPCTYELHGAYFLPILFILIFLLGLLGNSLIIWVIACGTRLRSMTDVCLLNLAVADLLLVCTLPFLAHEAWDQWVFGDALCKAVLGLYYIVLYCGIFFVCLMSIDQYLALVHAVYAMRARTRSFGMIAAAITWVAGFLSSFPDLIFLKQHVINETFYCFPFYPKNDDNDNKSSTKRHLLRIFSLFKMNILGLFVPFLIMCFCYSQIIWRPMSTQTSKKLAIRLVLVVLAVFLCCWVPYNLACFFKALELLGVYTGCESSKALTLALLRLWLTLTAASTLSCICLSGRSSGDIS